MDDVLSNDFLEALGPYMDKIQVVICEFYRELNDKDVAVTIDGFISTKKSWEVLDELGYEVFSGMDRFPSREWPQTLRLLEEFRPACWKLYNIIPDNELFPDLLALLGQCYSLARRMRSDRRDLDNL